MKYGFIAKKKEMTRIPVDGKLVPVTLLCLFDTSKIAAKTKERDGYEAVIIGALPKEKQNKNGKKILSYRKVKEFKGNIDYQMKPDEDLVGKKITIQGISKGKGFQGVMKRCNASGGPKTHGSKFHRAVGSTGNMKPRRVMKGHPHAGRMGGDKITLHQREVLDVVYNNTESLLLIRGSVPGAYNATLYVYG